MTKSNIIVYTKELPFSTLLFEKIKQKESEPHYLIPAMFTYIRFKIKEVIICFGHILISIVIIIQIMPKAFILGWIYALSSL